MQSRAPKWQVPFIGFKLNTADATIIHIEKCRSEAINVFRIPSSRRNVIRHGGYRFFREFATRSARLPWAKERGVRDILFFGAITRYKGLIYLIRAVGIPHAKGRLVRLLIAGRHVDAWDECDAALDSCGIRGNSLLAIRYIPFRDVPAYFQFADLVYLPYIEISESGVLHIAKAFDRPVVATSVGGYPEAYKEGYIQELAPPADPNALADAIERALFEPAGKPHFVSTPENDVRAWPVAVEQTLDLYHRVLANKRT